MIVYPAIDLMGGAVVRLRQGDPTRAAVVAADPVAAAQRFAAEGAEWLHVVDLDGAFAGAPRHLEVVCALCRAVEIPVQVGGGVRTMADVRAVFDAGAARAVLGTGALAGDLVRAAVEAFGDRVAVALDARGGMLAASGWRQDAGGPLAEAAVRLARAGAPRFIYTDIARDGMLSGPDLAGLAALIVLVGVPVIASGGIAAVGHLQALAAVGAEGAIVGRALYDGTLTLPQALAAVRGHPAPGRGLDAGAAGGSA